jgi:hypothetical protein
MDGEHHDMGDRIRNPFDPGGGQDMACTGRTGKTLAPTRLSMIGMDVEPAASPE